MTKDDLIAIGEMAALDGVSIDNFIAKMTSEGLNDKERKIALKGYRKFAK